MDRHVVLFAGVNSDGCSYGAACRVRNGVSLVSIASCLLVALTVLLGAANASAQGLACRVPQKEMVVADLLFGRNIGGRLGVTERRWARFLASEVTPRFPDGLTVVNAAGQWRDQQKNRIVRESSKRVTIITAAGPDTQDKIDAIVAAYKRQFRQQSVAVVIRPACVSF
jgi:hypothetical protein